MTNFNIDDVVDHIHKELGLTGSKTPIRRIVKHHFTYLFRVMKTKRDRISLKHCDLMSIYTNPDIKTMMGKVADLDETKVPAFENGFAVVSPKFRSRRQGERRGRIGAERAVEDLPKLNA